MIFLENYSNNGQSIYLAKYSLPNASMQKDQISCTTIHDFALSWAWLIEISATCPYILFELHGRYGEKCMHINLAFLNWKVKENLICGAATCVPPSLDRELLYLSPYLRSRTKLGYQKILETLFVSNYSDNVPSIYLVQYCLPHAIMQKIKSAA